MGEIKPKVRFEGFEDDWERRKLSSIITEKLTNGVMNQQSDLPTQVKHINVINMYKSGKIQIDDLTYSSCDDNSIKKCNVEIGDIFLTRSSLKPEGIAEANVLLDEGLFVFDDHLIRMKVDKKCYSPIFTNILLSTSVVKKQFISKSKQNAFTTIGQEDIAESDGFFPTLQEQIKIAEYFTTLDHLITLHQRKCDETKILKKYMLQKLFPQKEMNVPEIRFEGFTDVWEQRKLGEIVLRESSSRESSSDCPSVEYEDVIAEEGRLNKDISLKESNKKGIVFDGSQVLYGKLRPYLHNWLNPNFSGVAVGDWWVLKPIETDKNFIYRLIQTQQFDDVANLSAGSKMPRADWNLVSETEFFIPSTMEEQAKIAGYFSTLDHLITLHQRKCDALKDLKKYMLQNMFL